VLVGFLAMNFLRYANSRVHIIDLGHSHQIPCLAAAGAHFDFVANPWRPYSRCAIWIRMRIGCGP